MSQESSYPLFKALVDIFSRGNYEGCSTNSTFLPQRDTTWSALGSRTVRTMFNSTWREVTESSTREGIQGEPRGGLKIRCCVGI